MKRYVLALILLAGLALIQSGQTFAAAARPDLVITKINIKALASSGCANGGCIQTS